MGVYVDRLKKHFRFGIAETRDLLIAVLVLAFIFAFDDGRETFELMLWLKNFVFVLIIVVFSVLLHEIGHKLVALMAGYRSEFKIWPYGIAIGVILALISNGKLYFLAVGGVFIHHMAVHRLGMFRYGLSSFYGTVISFAGPFVNVILAFLAKVMFLATANPLIGTIVSVNLWYAIFSMLPIPPLDGSTGFFGGRSTYMWFFSFVVAAAIMIAVSKTLVVMLLGSLVLSVIFWFIYYYTVERLVA